MVEREFFVREVSKLFEQFGQNKFSQRKTDLIYLAVRSLNNEDFARIIDDIIGNCKFAPTVDDFKTRAMTYRKFETKQSDCTFCGGNGIISRYEKKTGYNYAFSCECKAGLFYPAFGKWRNQQQHLFTSFSPRKICAEGKGNPYEGKKEAYEKFLKRMYGERK